MLKLPIIFTAFSLLLSASALASTSMASSTLNDIANMQLTLEKAEYEKKLGELRGKSGTSTTPGSGSSSDTDFSSINPILKGVYGLGKRLYAIVDMGGTEVEFSTGDTYFGYRALSINTLETVLVKLDSKGNSKGGKVYRLRLTGGGDMSALRNLPPLPSVPMTSAEAERVPVSARPTPARPASTPARNAPATRPASPAVAPPEVTPALAPDPMKK